MNEKKKQQQQIIVIGGGAAGLMAAGRAAQRGTQVVLHEKMGQTGRKIGISGKGRCNISNSAELQDFISHFGKNGRFLRQCFDNFFTDDLVTFFADMGLALVTERGGRIFPRSGRALDVVKTLNKWLNQHNVTVKKESPVSSIIVEDGRVAGITCDNHTIACDKIIVATGGKSYPRTGSTGDGYNLLTSLGHTLTAIRPALVPLECRDNRLTRLAELSGLNLKNVNVRLYINGKRKSQHFGEIAFTGTGLSGPVALTISGAVVDYLDKGDSVSISIDLKPALADKQLDRRLIRDFEKRGGEPIGSLLRGLIPHQLIDTCLKSCNIPPQIDTLSIPAKMRKAITLWLKDFRLDISGYRGFDEAIITAGGINLAEINPKTMESKLVKGLYIVGELLDLQADTGGYNLQMAFSSGWLAGSSVSVE